MSETRLISHRRVDQVVVSSEQSKKIRTWTATTQEINLIPSRWASRVQDQSCFLIQSQGGFKTNWVLLMSLVLQQPTKILKTLKLSKLFKHRIRFMYLWIQWEDLRLPVQLLSSPPVIFFSSIRHALASSTSKQLLSNDRNSHSSYFIWPKFCRNSKI